MEEALKADAARDRVGHFRLLRHLGSGGQGTVHLAEDTRLHRNVALKILRERGGGHDDRIERFWREASIASRLDHPSICAIHEAGLIDGVPCIAMRYVDGESLAQRIARDWLHGPDPVAPTKISPPATGVPPSGSETVPMPVGAFPGAAPAHDVGCRGPRIDEVLLVIEQVARALDVAHDAGVIHRDIKPGNVMLARDGTPVILDFGLARADESSGPTLTATAQRTGTPAYMSPEQILLPGSSLDRRTDVYALGVVLFEWLTGRRPFEAPTLDALYHQILDSLPPDPRPWNGAVSRDLAAVVLAAIERERDRRYATAKAFADDLRAVRASLPVSVAHRSRIGRLTRWARQRPAAAALFAVLALGIPVVAGLAGWLWRNMPEVERARLQAAEVACDAEVEDAFVKLLDHDLIGAAAAFDRALALSPRADALAGAMVTCINRRDAAREVALADAHPELLAQSVALRAMRTQAAGVLTGDPRPIVFEKTGGQVTALDFFIRGCMETMQAERLPADAAKQALARFEAAIARAERPNRLFHMLAIRTAGEAGELAVLKRYCAAATSLWPRSVHVRLYCGTALSTFDERAALAELDEALRLRPGWVKAELLRAKVLLRRGDATAARAALETALGHEPDSAEVHNWLGVIDAQSGDDAAAVTHYRRAVDLSPEWVVPWTHLSTSLGRLDDLAGAMDAAEHATRCGPDSPIAWGDLGLARSALQENAGAAAAFRRAVELAPGDTLAACRLARELLTIGEFSEATRVLDAARAHSTPYDRWHEMIESLATRAASLEAGAAVAEVARARTREIDDETEAPVAAEVAARRGWFDVAFELFLRAEVAVPDLFDSGDPELGLLAARSAVAGLADATAPPRRDGSRLAAARRWLVALLGRHRSGLERDEIDISISHATFVGLRSARCFDAVRGERLTALEPAERKEWFALWADVDQFIVESAPRR